MKEQPFLPESESTAATGPETTPGLRQQMSADREMYRLPGDLSITDVDIDRYVESNADIRQIEPELIDLGLDDSDIQVRERAVKLIGLAPETDRTRLIERSLNDANVRMEAAKLIGLAPEADRPRLQQQVLDIIERGLSENAAYHRRTVAKLIDLAPEADRAKLIERGLGDGDAKVRGVVARLIDLAPEADRARLIERGLGDGDAGVRGVVARLIDLAPDVDRPRLQQQVLDIIEWGFNDEDGGVRIETAKLIGLVKEADRTRLIEQGLGDSDAGVRGVVAKLIDLAPEADRPRLQQQVLDIIERGFNDEDGGVRIETAKLIGLAKEADRTRRIDQGLRDVSVYVRRETAKLIGLATEDNYTRLIEQGLGDIDVYVRIETAKLIGLAPETDRARLIERCFVDRYHEVRNAAAHHIEHVPETDRTRLIDALIARNPAIRTLAGLTPLYKHHPARFFRGGFDKTGSSTTLLDAVPGQPERSLRDRLIIRHIDQDAYFSWREAYENTAAWKEAGFDYVPIEPIVKANIRQDLTTDVFARVLRGPSVATWKYGAGLYLNEINERVGIIMDVLGKLGIDHGHLHPSNFIVVFERDAEDAVILNRPPRVYVIDFDRAQSKPNEPR